MPLHRLSGALILIKDNIKVGEKSEENFQLDK